jgi:hypothetical protein
MQSGEAATSPGNKDAHSGPATPPGCCRDQHHDTGNQHEQHARQRRRRSGAGIRQLGDRPATAR